MIGQTISQHGPLFRPALAFCKILFSSARGWMSDWSCDHPDPVEGLCPLAALVFKV